jgi:hypothetical protein
MAKFKLADRATILAVSFLLMLTLPTWSVPSLRAQAVASQQAAVEECLDPIQDCNSPKYLGKKGICACFSCQKIKPDDQLRVVCTSRPEQKSALFEAEERDNTFQRLTQNALTKAGSVTAFKQNVQNFDLDPNQLVIGYRGSQAENYLPFNSSRVLPFGATYYFSRDSFNKFANATVDPDGFTIKHQFGTRFDLGQKYYPEHRFDAPILSYQDYRDQNYPNQMRPGVRFIF